MTFIRRLFKSVLALYLLWGAWSLLTENPEQLLSLVAITAACGLLVLVTFIWTKVVDRTARSTRPRHW